MPKNLPILIMLLFFFALQSCEKVTDYYLGIPQQPEFTDETFVEGMNIFGLIRPDSRGEFNKSFVFIQQVYRALNESDFELIRDAEVRLYILEEGVVIDTVDFPLVPSDSLFSDTLYRSLEYFKPEIGMTYRLICEHQKLPVAIGETIFPPPPGLIDGSLSVSANRVQLSLSSDTRIKMVDVYYTSDEGGGFLGRFVPQDSTPMNISVQLPADLTEPDLIIYGYDGNFADYYANSNISLNFNKYRTTISTLESGFGVFGALNFLKVDLY
jgi:hypothetical protein